MSVSRSALAVAGRAIRDQYRLGLGLFVAAPVAVAIVMLPELVQHIAEIRLGMFDSREAARALANDPTRWAFGYAKLTGVALAFLACARAVWCGLEGGRWYDPRDVAWPRLVVGFILFMAVGSAGYPVLGLLSQPAKVALNTVLTVASLPFLFLTLAGLFGDRATPWRALLLRSWPAALLMVLLFVTGFAAMQVLHTVNHRFALGQPALLVWALMIWDTFVVGAIAALTGAAFALSYRLARDRAVSGV